MGTSRERFLAQLERRVKYQSADIPPPTDLPWAQEETYHWSMEIIPPEPMGNGDFVDCETQSTFGLRPPGDDPVNEWWV